MTADELLESSTRATFAVVLTDLRQSRPVALSVDNPLSFFMTSQSRLVLDQPLLGNSSRKRRELHFFSTSNAFITTRSYRDILPILLM